MSLTVVGANPGGRENPVVWADHQRGAGRSHVVPIRDLAPTDGEIGGGVRAAHEAVVLQDHVLDAFREDVVLRRHGNGPGVVVGGV